MAVFLQDLRTVYSVYKDYQCNDGFIVVLTRYFSLEITKDAILPHCSVVLPPKNNNVTL